MKPVLHPHLVNGAVGDPVLYVDFLYDRRALLMDLGDIHTLSPGRVLRVSDIFVSHTHMDHFIGFDHLLRILLGRDHTLRLYGPPGVIDRVEHKLAAYTWNLVENYDTDFTLLVTEMLSPSQAHRARFRCKARFRREAEPPPGLADGVLLDEETFCVRAVELEHRVPCLAFALEEKIHINIWKNRLDDLGLPTGPWLRELKSAVLRGVPDDTPFEIQWCDQKKEHHRVVPLGQLKAAVLRTVPGQKIAYVTDAIDEPENARRIVDLARDADLLFIETFFLEADIERARRTFHLTARQAGRLGREAGVKGLVPMHFSARYEDHGKALRREALNAFYDGAFAGGGDRALD
ncbi:MAG: ribonuclease Z [Thermodesulfobacteriota bacterium]